MYPSITLEIIKMLIIMNHNMDLLRDEREMEINLNEENRRQDEHSSLVITGQSIHVCVNNFFSSSLFFIIQSPLEFYFRYTNTSRYYPISIFIYYPKFFRKNIFIYLFIWYYNSTYYYYYYYYYCY